MSDTHDSGLPGLNEEGAHEGPIKTPKQLMLAVFASFVIPIGVIVLLINFVDFGTRPGAGSDGFSAEAVAQRLRPVGQVDFRDINNPAAMRTGEQVFAGQCTACHTAGAAGAPKIGDTAAWAPRIKTGFDALWHSALAGKGAMSPQGGGDYTDYEIARAVVYMANKGGASFAEPPAPAASGAAADGASDGAASGAADGAAAGAATAAAASAPK